MRSAEVCAGYNGLGMAVEEVFGSETAWFSEFDEAPSKILAHHYPNVPNHGDMTKIDWAAIEPVDILAGGTPCQDLSAAGRRAGMTEGTRSNLWVHMREAIATMRPTYVVWENVRGAYSACADSEMGQCPGCVDRRQPHRPFLRALGRVLGDLSDLGYDCQWRGLRASDVGACHARFRVFVLAQDRDGGRSRRGAALSGNGETSRADLKTDGSDNRLSESRTTASTASADAHDAGWSEQRWTAPVQPEHSPAEHEGSNATYANGGDDDGWLGGTQRGTERREAPPGGGEGPRTVTDACSAALGEHPRGSSAEEARPGCSDGPSDHHGERPATNWGPYQPAIERWERTIGRGAPRPTEPTGRDGGERLSPRFTEWMMGLPDGWVTDPAIGISRNEQLKACGNGVVPQQAIAALRDMLAAFQSQ